MESPVEKSDRNQTPRDDTVCMSWGMILGAVAGVLVGLFANHWAGGTLLGAFAGGVIGALLDRHRR